MWLLKWLAIGGAAAAGIALFATRGDELTTDERYAVAMTFVELGNRAHEDEIRGVLEALANRHALYLGRGLPSTLRKIVLSQLDGVARWGSVPDRYNPVVERRVRSLGWEDDPEVQRRIRLLRDVVGGARKMPFKVINFVHPAGVPNSPSPRRTLDPVTRRFLPTFSVLASQTQDGHPPGAARRRHDLTRGGRLTVFSA